MKKSKDFGKNMLGGLKQMPKAIGLMAKGTPFYKETPQVRGRISRALAKETKGGKGKVAKRPAYKKDMKKGLRDKTRQERGKIVRALAKNTKGGKGRIAKRPEYKKHVPMR